MFTLTRPHSIDASFEQMYRYLIGILEPLAGYPLKLERGPARTSDAAVRPSRREDGSIEFPLHSSKNRKATWSLVVPPDGAADRQCTRIVTRFMLTCNRLAREIRQSSGIKDYLVRNGVFMWDDLVVSLTHAGGQKINTLELIAALRETLLFRYEERPVRVGVLMTWNWHSTSKYLSEAGCHVLTTRKPDDIQRTLRDSKALNWLADGTNSLLLLTPKGRVGGWFSISALRTPEPTADWSMVPHRYHHLRKLLVGKDVICTTSQTGELFLFRKDSVMKWTHEGWRRVSGPGITGSLSAYVPEEAASVLSDVAVDMSFRKRGGLIVVVRDPSEISADASPGLNSYFREDPLLEITRADFPLIVRMASLDGCLIVDSAGAIRNAGVILNLPGAHTGAGEGARSAAASFASTHGLAIKISQDGPISIYESGVVTRFA
jgi:hypothetical protein